MLDNLYLGVYYFEAAAVLRASLLLSTLLSNSEAWVNLNKADVEKLARIDEQFLRKIFSSPISTPKVLLYTEAGATPIRFILMSRRLNFVWYILHEDEDSLIRRFFDAMCSNPIKGDWATTVKEDLKQLNMDMNIDDIYSMPKHVFKKMVKDKVKHAAVQYLNGIKMTKSKAKDLKYDSLSLQEYLSSKCKMNIEEKQFIFHARSRMLNLKSNFKQGVSDISCSACKIEEESQRHLLQCTALADNSVLPNNVPQYDDLMGQDLQKVEAIGRILRAKFKLFKVKTNQTNALADATCSASD